MCRHPLHPLLAALPKTEHHIHLEGALPPSLLFTLSTRNNVPLPSPTTDPAFASPSTLLDRYTRFTSLDDFLQYYFIGMSCLLTTADFEELGWSYFTRAKADGVVHAEVFFDPQAHTSRGVSYGTVVEGFERACRRAEKELGMSTKLIMCFLRHLPVVQAEACFEEAEGDLRSGRVGGIGLDSSEKGFPPGKWKGVYEKAKSMGVRRTAHAGEEGPVGYIAEALRELDVERVDHGIRLVEDKELMREVARSEILITVCPLSNVRLRCVESVEGLPIREFLENGVRFSINSDDPAYFGGYVLDNYCAVQEAFGLSVGDWGKIAKAGALGSWCGEERKREILGEIERVIGVYREG